MAGNTTILLGAQKMYSDKEKRVVELRILISTLDEDSIKTDLDQLHCYSSWLEELLQIETINYSPMQRLQGDIWDALFFNRRNLTELEKQHLFTDEAKTFLDQLFRFYEYDSKRWTKENKMLFEKLYGQKQSR